MNDSKMEIPLNKELFDNVIKDAFDYEIDDEKGEEINIKNMTDD